ncbi:hypothetical protein RB195_024573 [Necator americanus]|uniref:Uncharacterized protein n=1 Tax=Necator americanus TaxID=51031 RepID=A0ABR1ENR3_NECAM
MWQSQAFYPEEHRTEMRTVKLYQVYLLARSIPQSDIGKSRAVRNVAFDSDYCPVLLSYRIRFYRRTRLVPIQPKIDMAGHAMTKTKNAEQTSVNVCIFMLVYGPGKSFAMGFLRKVHSGRIDIKAKELEGVWEDKNLRKAYASLN